MLDDPLAFLLLVSVGMPLLAALLTWIFGRALGEQSHWLPIAGVGLALAAAVPLMVGTAWLEPAAAPVATETANVQATSFGVERVVNLWTWVDFQQVLGSRHMHHVDSLQKYNLTIDIALRIDPLTSMMLLIVNFVGLLVVLFSIGYMHGDPGYGRYFATVSLFVFAMNLLVSASNFLVLYCGWEGVGLCSYLLIGFWFRKPEAQAAAKKAFMMIRIGDVAFVVAIFLIWIYCGTLNFHDTYGPDGTIQEYGLFGQTALIESARVGEPSLLGLSEFMAVSVALLLFLAACAKSAQFPLHTWLPDAMEGPTPVSALIHAATMVTAGVYLVARCLPLFAVASGAGEVVSIIGCLTALLAALIALTQTDLKRVLAYSTISQLGFMFMALGTGTALGAAAAMFHLFTHALFKALLFLGAGSVMHGMGNVIDMRRFGGLRRVMPVTHLTFAVGALALAGVPPLAGFFSKDEILVAIYEQGMILGDDGGAVFYTIFGVAIFTALLTAAYTARAYFLTFWGEEVIPHEAGDHAHESPSIMTVPLVILALGTLGAGFLWGPLSDFLYRTPSLAWALSAKVVPHADIDTVQAHVTAAGAGIVAMMLGLGIVAFLYLQDRKELSLLTGNRSLQGLQQLSYNRFYIDELYTVFIVWPALVISKISGWLDRSLLDGLVRLVAWLPRGFGHLVRFGGAGLVSYYALAMTLGLLVLVLVSGVLEFPPTQPVIVDDLGQ